MNDDEALPPAGAADERFAASLRRHLDTAGMSQGELARIMHAAGWPWHQQTVAKILNGKRKVEVGEADTLTRVLGTTIAQMLLPGPEAAAQVALEQLTGTAHRAYRQIAAGAEDLAGARRQLSRVVGDAEARDCYGSALVRRLAAGAKQAILLDPNEAVGEGTRSALRDEG
jgi:Helix-turn-helix